MINLYNRDAAAATEALKLLVDLRSDPNAVDAFNGMVSWEPADVAKTNPPVGTASRAPLVVGRLNAIIAAVDEQLRCNTSA